MLKLFPRKRAASGTSEKLVQRKVSFDWQDTPVDWIPGEPFASHFVNEINLLLPAGEFWFCKLYNQALPLITDAKLRDDVQGFMRQEAMHARAHAGALAQYLAERGLETESNIAFEHWLFDVVLGDEPFGRRLPKFMQREWLVFRLGVVAAIEHMTCVLGRYVLQGTGKWDALGADPTLMDLVRWHGAEEVEHRCVAFDVYRHLGGSYPSRYYLASITMPLVYGLWVRGAAHLMKQDERFAGKRPGVFRPWIWWNWWRHARRGLLPSPFWLLAQELPFFMPGYDPQDEPATADAHRYLEHSLAAQRAAA
ncbi:MAG: metal-dependent hydrolase [Nevskiaceae bacterium]|nr:MAG: metal-dependent hydrolase [Nevskiaceae bacterium]TBR71803.1 MAG: metal-dependent hydrolase [Nevskiaceae bacterium]